MVLTTSLGHAEADPDTGEQKALKNGPAACQEECAQELLGAKILANDRGG